MVKFEKVESTHKDDFGNEYQGIDIIMKTDHEEVWICEAGNWNDQDAHFWADEIMDGLFRRHGEF